MSTATRKPQLARLRGAIHAEAGKRGLDEATRRDLIEQVTGHRSTRDLDQAQCLAVLDRLKGREGSVGRQVRAKRPHDRKIRALWLSLYHLGAVEDPSERALASFARRQLKVDALEWTRPEDASAIIEALKGWCAREGVDWSAFPDPARCVLSCQIRRLTAAGQPLPDEALRLAPNAAVAELGPIIREIG